MFVEVGDVYQELCDYEDDYQEWDEQSQESVQDGQNYGCFCVLFEEIFLVVIKCYNVGCLERKGVEDFCEC